MATAVEHATLTIALIGNPNTGKSTLFTALAGVRQRVANYPGVTVEKKIGHASFGGRRFALVDLPGTYSLAPRSIDEMVAVDVLLGRQRDMQPPDAVLCIVDASNLERNLYLVSQVLELGLPTVLALNMTDIAAERGIRIDAGALSRRLNVRVVEVQANKGRGVAELKLALVAAAQSPASAPESPFPEAFRREVSALESAFSHGDDAQRLPRYLAERLLLDTGGYLETSGAVTGNGQLAPLLSAARDRLRLAGMPVPAIEAMVRYDWVERTLDGLVTKPATRATASDKIDRVLTDKLWGTLVFAAMMLAVFTSIFKLAKWPMDMITDGVGAAGDWVGGFISPGPLQSLLVDGVFGGVGSVLVFLPQILILFFFIAVSEDCGYMARAAYLMDRLMAGVGLSGKSFIPLLSSFACAIPGIMATRVIENRRDRLTTILVAPLMSCSARLPVYMLLIAAFIPSTSYLGGLLGLQGLVLLAMYLVGLLTAVLVSLVLKKTLLRGATPPFVMELPTYKWPSAKIVFQRMFERGWDFVYRAGTVIFAVMVLVWAAGYYPHNAADVEAPFAQRNADLAARRDALDANKPSDVETLAAVKDDEDQLGKDIAGAYQRQSYLGRAGQFIEPVVKPLGWDWRIGSAAIASFPAREVVIGALGVIYNLGRDDELKEKSEPLQDMLRSATWDGTDRKVYNVPVALSIMVFFALCAQCAATLAVIRRETNSWRWPVFTFVYMTTLAYIAAFATYQIGMRM